MNKRRFTAAVLAIMICACAAGCSDGNGSAAPESAVSQPQISDANASETTSDDNAEVSRPVLSFDKENGFYDKPIELTLTCSDPDAVIYYTTDGSIPDSTKDKYTKPIKLANKSSADNMLCNQRGTTAGEEFIPNKSIKKANVIRAVAVSNDGTASEIINGTFFVGLDRKKLYGDVPVISLFTDFNNLFSYETGIYVLGQTYDKWKSEQLVSYEAWEAEGNYSMRGKEWERPVTVQFIEADGTTGFTEDMGMRIMGAASRNATQKSFRITARDEYGKKNIQYKMLPDNIRSDGSGEVEKYKSFLLRNGGNDCDYAKIRDPLFQMLTSGRRFDTQQFRPVVVYLDGEYWGMYTLVEDYNDNYIENNYGIDNKNVVIVKRSNVEEGNDEDIELYNDMFDFITNNDMTDETMYEKASSMLDIGSYIDYCALNMYIYNEDSIFKDNNWEMWRVREADGKTEQSDGKWRMMVFDTDYSAGIYDGGGNFRKDNVSRILDGKADRWNNPEEFEYGYRDPLMMFRSLYKNENFKRELVTVLSDMRNVDFNADSAIAAELELYEVYGGLVPATFRRFGPGWIAWQNTEVYYEQKINELAEFIDGRYEKFPEIMQTAFGLSDSAEVMISVSDSSKGNVILNTTPLDMTKDFKGDYFVDYPVSVNAVAENGAKFVRWEVIGGSISDENSAEAVISFTGDVTIKAVFE